MSNSYGENIDNNIASNTGNTDSDGWQSVEPTTVNSDESLQNDLNGESTQQDDGALNVNGSTWGGMESGAIGRDSTQSSDWLSTVPWEYRSLAYKWSNQQGMVKVIPVQQRQKFTYSTVSYIASKQEEPKTQTFPISDVSVVPHQITFDFYDTTEGRVGVSNAVEKHMQVEFDVYLTDLLAQFWIFGEDNQYIFGLASDFPNLKKAFWDAIDTGSYLSFENDLEQTVAFSNFRNTFLQQHSGWVCKFVSHTFGVFQGVITDVSYNIGSGESFAKWHVKLEEAVFMRGAYSTSGQKPSSESSTDSSQEQSGDATNGE